MLTYLEKFNNLPKEIKDKISNNEISSFLSNLKDKYGLNLSSVIIKVVVGEIKMDNLINYLIDNFKIARKISEEVVSSLDKNIFSKINLQEFQNTPENNLPIIEPPHDIIEYGEGQEIISPKNETDLEKDISGIREEMKNDFDEKIQEIIKKSGVLFSNESLKKRLENILLTYLKGVRDKISIKQSLVKDYNNGGLGFDSESAENIILLASGNVKENQKLKINNPNILVEEKEEKNIINLAIQEKKDESKIDFSSLGVRDFEYDLKKLENNKPVPAVENNKMFSDKINNNENPQKEEERIQDYKEKQGEIVKENIFEEKLNQKNEIKEIKKDNERQNLFQVNDSENKKDHQPKEEDVQKEGLIENQDFKKENLSQNKEENIVKEELKNISISEVIVDKPLINYQTTKNGKIKMDDIKFKEKIFDPIDELRFMFLKNFRFLNKDPFLAIEKIKNKIDFLEKEGYSKKVEAILAWKSSPVFKMYSSVLNYGLQNGKTLEESLKIKQKDSSDFLTKDEFSAILKLNQIIR